MSNIKPTYGQVAQYIKNNGGTPEDAYNKVVIVYEGGSQFIESWNLQGIPQPDNSIWNDYPEYIPVPSSVTRMQLRLALIDEGFFPDMVASLIEQTFQEEPIQLAKAMVAWNDALIYERSHPLVISIGTALGFDTPDKIDNIFRKAVTYK